MPSWRKTFDYVQAAYFNPDSRNTVYLLIPFYEYQGTRHTAHAPQACLLGGGWALTQSQERMVSLDDGNQIKIMTMNLEKGNDKILGSYFFLQRGRVVTSPWMNKYYLMMNKVQSIPLKVIERRNLRKDGAGK